MLADLLLTAPVCQLKLNGWIIILIKFDSQEFKRILVIINFSHVLTIVQVVLRFY